MKEIDQTTRRGDCFRLLAACFYEPDKQLFLEEELGGKLLQLFCQLSPNCIEAAKKMEKALKELEQQQMSIDHAALFVGPFELLAAPYGSVYMDEKGTVMGDSTIKAAEQYQNAGLLVEIKEPPDHIAIELEFMSYLCAKEAAALGSNRLDKADRIRKQQIFFFFSALKPWAGKFCKAIRAGTANGFYVNLADCLECFLISCERFYSDDNAL